jgi:hypothetical protein
MNQLRSRCCIAPITADLTKPDHPLMLIGLAPLYCRDCGQECETIEVESTAERRVDAHVQGIYAALNRLAAIRRDIVDHI